MARVVTIPIGPIFTSGPCRGIIHVIEKGDTLYKLGQRYHVSVSTIMYANPYVNIYNLQIGDELCIPVGAVPREAEESMDAVEIPGMRESGRGNLGMEEFGREGFGTEEFGRENSVLEESGRGMSESGSINGGRDTISDWTQERAREEAGERARERVMEDDGNKADSEPMLQGRVGSEEEEMPQFMDFPLREDVAEKRHMPVREMKCENRNAKDITAFP